MNVHIRQPQHDTTDSPKLTEDVWRVVALYLQTDTQASPLEALFLNDLLANWHGALTAKQEKQLLSMYNAIRGDYDVDEEDAIDEVIVRKFLNELN